MILWDVNVLVQACVPKAPHHRVFRNALQESLRGAERFALYGPILSGVLRICTHPRIFKPPADPQTVFPFLEHLRGDKRAIEVGPGPRHWAIFRDLVGALGLRGGDITDAWFAALAIEHGCEWWTGDSGFQRFPGLRLRLLTPRE